MPVEVSLTQGRTPHSRYPRIIDSRARHYYGESRFSRRAAPAFLASACLPASRRNRVSFFRTIMETFLRRVPRPILPFILSLSLSLLSPSLTCPTTPFAPRHSRLYDALFFLRAEKRALTYVHLERGGIATTGPRRFASARRFSVEIIADEGNCEQSARRTTRRTWMNYRSQGYSNITAFSSSSRISRGRSSSLLLLAIYYARTRRQKAQISFGACTFVVSSN